MALTGLIFSEGGAFSQDVDSIINERVDKKILQFNT